MSFIVPGYQGVFQRLITALEKGLLPEGDAIQWEEYASLIAERCRLDFRGPDFLSISPARSATTWLFRQLRRNPSVFLPEVKETNYFVSGWLDGPYERYFSDWRPPQLAGDISPNYSLLPRRAVSEVHRIYPETRLICILRNPIERVWSQLLFDLLRKDGSHRMSHHEVSALPEQAILTLLACYSSLNRYDEILERWLASYSPDHFYIDFFDSIRKSPGTLLRRICRFLDVPDCGPSTDDRINALEYGTIEMPVRVREFLRALYAPQLENLNRVLVDHFGFGTPDSWRVDRVPGPGSFKIVDDYRGWDAFFSGSRYSLVPHPGSDTKNVGPPALLKRMLPTDVSARERMLEGLMLRLCENRECASGPTLLTSHRDHNLVLFHGRFYALPHSLGVWEGWQTQDPESVPGVMAGGSLGDLVAKLNGSVA